MDACHENVASIAAPPIAARRFRPRAFGAYLTIAIIAAAAIAGLAFGTQRLFAPLLLFPAVVGAMLGVALVASLRLADARHRPSVLTGAGVAVLLAVFSRHFISYQVVRTARSAEFTETSERIVLSGAFAELSQRLESPESFGDFLRASAERGVRLYGRHVAGGGMWLLWGVDLVITLVVALVIVNVALGRPYCDACGSWYRAVRRGTLDAGSAAALAQTLRGEDSRSAGPTPSSEAIHQEAKTGAAADVARYRLCSCRGGCGPIGCQLSWNERRETSDVVWLNAAGRDRVTAILDQASRRQT